MSSWYHDVMVKQKQSADDNRLPPRSIRVSEEDWKRWQALAERDSLPLSTWIKQVIKREERRIERRDKGP
jgi:hypothetical protein